MAETKGDAPGRAAGQPETIRSVLLATRLLEILAERGAMGVTELARAAGTGKTRVHRHLRTLVQADFVTQDPATEKYGLGLKLWLLGRMVAEQIDFLGEVRKVMPGLRDQVGHTVTAAQGDAEGVRVIEMVRGTSLFEIGTRPGSRFSFHGSAQGKLALAFGPPELLARVAAGPLAAATERTITTPERLAAEVAQVRAQGWAVAPEEVLPGINALAAPVFQADGGLAGTLAVVDSVRFLPAVPSRAQIEAVVAAADRASRGLGHLPRAA